MRLLAMLVLVPFSVQSETIFIESEISTLLKSTYSIHAGTSAGMDHGEIYATYMEGSGHLSGISRDSDFTHKSWGVGYRKYREDLYKGRFWGVALRSADIDQFCVSGNPECRFSKHNAAILSFGSRIPTGLAYETIRGHISWVLEGGVDFTNSEGDMKQRWIFGISLNWGFSII